MGKRGPWQYGATRRANSVGHTTILDSDRFREKGFYTAKGEFTHHPTACRLPSAKDVSEGAASASAPRLSLASVDLAFPEVGIPLPQNRDLALGIRS